jgi:dihydrofolate synthase/folylpolyglutamate synthase
MNPVPRAAAPLAFEALYAKRPQVIKPGLERIKVALKHLPRLKHFIDVTPTVLIGGTNGKGTTAGYLYQLSFALGVKAGLFSSPHLREFRERIQCTHLEIDDSLLLAALAELKALLPPPVYEELSFFEVNTLLALLVFKKIRVELCIMEVGLGGRFDSTNVMNPQVSVITSIGMDHVEFLGSSPAAIAREKAGIMRSGKAVLWAGKRGGEAAADEVVRDEAKKLGALLSVLGEGQWQYGDLSKLPKKWQAMPSYLRRNAQLAIMAAETLFPAKNLFQAVQMIDASATDANATDANATDANATDANATDANATVPIPPTLIGRFQELTVGPRQTALLLDVCHNVEGAQAFVDGLKEKNLVPCPALISVLGDKDVNGILDVLTKALSPVVLFASASERTWTPKHLALRHQSWRFEKSLEAAWDHWSQVKRAKSGKPLVICGSVAVAGEVLDFFDVPV